MDTLNKIKIIKLVRDKERVRTLKLKYTRIGDWGQAGFFRRLERNYDLEIRKWKRQEK